MNLFGRKKSPAAPGGPSDPAQTILKLRSTVETLEKRQRKKMYEAEIEKINGAAHAEQQMIAIEATVTNAETVNAMKSGAKAMQAARQNVDADTGRPHGRHQGGDGGRDEISAISAPANDVLNDDDLLNELNEMEELELESQLLSAPIPRCRCRRADRQRSTSPRRPRRCRRRRRRRTDMKALRELEAAMAM
ncbi:hypothetical protein JL720_13959 [Aureococcus anophagefferens]|nr:hypothetical protein JL720_13959 [Aureococcus anophagefferens]